MALKDVVGQERPIHILRGCIAKGRIPHALLFTGDEGIGKYLTALNFARTLNCSASVEEDLFSFGADKDTDAPDSDQDACDNCPSCRKIGNNSHPDVFVIRPEGDGKQITVSAIRQLEESLSYKPFEGKWKIAIIDDADRLNKAAANAFLRTLEEPAGQSILILVSSRPDMLLPTIRSRCQTINFSPLPVDTMSSLLREKSGDMDETQSRLLSLLSGGRLGYALDADLIRQRDRAFDMFRNMLGGHDEDIWEDRESMEDWIEWSQLMLRDIAVCKATGRTGLLVNYDRADEIQAIAGQAGLRDILKLARELYNIKRQLRFNLNKQLTFNYISLLLKRRLRCKVH